MTANDSAPVRAGWCRALAILTIWATIYPALADDDSGGPSAQEDAVTKRSRSEYDPAGADLGDLWYGLGRVLGMPRISQSRRRLQGIGTLDFFPKLEFTTTYDDNIFKSDTDKPIVDDAVFVVAPSFQIKSDWDNHSFDLAAGAKVGRYKKLSSEDYFDYFSRVGGAIDVTERSRVTMNTGYSRGTEARSSIDDLGAGFPPTKISTTNGGVDWDYTGDRFRLRAGATAKHLDYSRAGPVDNSDRNYLQTEASVRPGWELLPGTAFFVEPRVNIRERSKALDRNGLNRDSKGGQVLAGVTWDASGVTYLEIAGGFLRQDYEDPALRDVSGPTFNVRALWNATELMTLTLEGSRFVDETETTSTSGVLRTAGNFTADYELLENLLLNASEKYTVSNFQGNGRRDRTSESTGGLKYLLNANMYIGLNYSRLVRSSNFAGDGYRNNVASVLLGLQF